MDIAQFLKDYGELISITLIPPILWFLGNKFQDRKARRQLKENTFLRMMANRKNAAISPQMTEALNSIDVVFQDSKTVRAAWAAYYDSLHTTSPHHETSSMFLLDLLSEIAKDLGYSDLKPTELDRFYTAQGTAENIGRRNLIDREILRLLLHSKSYGEPLNDKELEEHLRQRGITDIYGL